MARSEVGGEMQAADRLGAGSCGETARAESRVSHETNCHGVEQQKRAPEGALFFVDGCDRGSGVRLPLCPVPQERAERPPFD